MKEATQDILQKLDRVSEARKEEILSAADTLIIPGTSYYVSSSGNDENDGLTPETPWKTLKKVSDASLCPGDGVLFCRGDLFRGQIKVKAGVTYCAYGVGEKPKLYGWDKDLADPAIWTEINPEKHIWQLTEGILDPGTLVFNGGEAHSLKLIPSYLNGKFVCREDESKDFDMAEEMVRDLDIFWHFDSILTTVPSKGEDFPIPKMGEQSFGTLYLRCDRGNPGAVFSSIEALTRRCMFAVGDVPNVHIDNLCMKYIGLHAVAAGGNSVSGLRVTNCEIGWIGGTIQHYFGTDPNYPQGGRGTVTRFGNGVEIYGGCEDYEVSNCYIYQVYDAAITHQVTTGGKPFTMKNVLYKDNLVEHCVYSIEYFLEMTNGDTESVMDGIEMCGNILRYAGYGWGQQRHNKNTPAHIKGWSFENRAKNFRIHHNTFDRCAYRMLHLVAQDEESCPTMESNTYIQHMGGLIGQYGSKENGEPPMLIFDENAAKTIWETFGDSEASIYYLP